MRAYMVPRPAHMVQQDPAELREELAGIDARLGKGNLKWVERTRLIARKADLERRIGAAERPAALARQEARGYGVTIRGIPSRRFFRPIPRDELTEADRKAEARMAAANAVAKKFRGYSIPKTT